MYCIAHAAVLSIQEDGKCRGMVCSADPFLCNIYEENAFQAVHDRMIHAVQCPMNICGCNTNDWIPKFSSREEAMHFMEVVDAKQKALFDATR